MILRGEKVDGVVLEPIKVFRLKRSDMGRRQEVAFNP
jgi:hypothetical protein